MSNQIAEFVNRRKFTISFLFGLMMSIIGFFGLLVNPASNNAKAILQVGGIIMVIVTLVSFWYFFTSERRINHQMTAIHASSSLSGFYKIYFPIIILSYVVLFIGAFAWLEPERNGWGLIDQDISPTGYLVLGIIPSIVIAIGIIILSDLEMRKLGILYSPRKENLSNISAMFYSFPLIGLYFGMTLLTRFILQLTYGPGSLVPTVPDIYRIDGQLIEVSRFWIFLTSQEKMLTLIAFFLLYFAFESIFRGLIGNHMRAMGLGAGGIVFVPAIVQAFALSSGNLIFTDQVYYFYILFESIIFGIVLGIILWRTGRFGITVFTALLIRFLDSSSDFQRTCLNMLPKAFGEYDPADGVITLADQISTYITFFQIILVIFTPFIILASYNETWKVISTLINDLRNQWFGYLVLGFAFFLIDLIFSYFASQIDTILIGFVISIIIIGIVLNFLFKVLPQPDILDFAKMEQNSQALYGGNKEFPINPLEDIAFLESSARWFHRPKRIGIIISILYFYLLFLSAAYRQFTLFNTLEIIQYTIFLLVLPASLLGISAYFLTNSLQKGYYFSEDWRKPLVSILTIVLIYNLIAWTISGSLAQFSWRNTTLFIVFLLVVYPKPIRTPLKEYANGFGREGRFATFRYIYSYPSIFKDVYYDLLELNSDQALIGSKIMASQLGIVHDMDELEILRNEDSTIAEKIASTFALGILRAKSSEGAILNQISSDNLNLKIVSYWALGRIGNQNSLGRMARILEENPLKSLIPIAEKAILAIDPYYPLAGLRDNITIES